MTIDADTLARLRTVAKDASDPTWGPWRYRDMNEESQVVFGEQGEAAEVVVGNIEIDQLGQFVATFDPPTVLALIEEIERLREEYAALDEATSEWKDATLRAEAALAKIVAAFNAPGSSESLDWRDNLFDAIRDAVHGEGDNA